MPREAADIEQAVMEIAAELNALSQTTRPATSQPSTMPTADPASQLDGWRTELWIALQGWHGQLREMQRLDGVLHPTDEEVSKLTRQIAEWRAETKETTES